MEIHLCFPAKLIRKLWLKGMTKGMTKSRAGKVAGPLKKLKMEDLLVAEMDLAACPAILHGPSDFSV